MFGFSCALTKGFDARNSSESSLKMMGNLFILFIKFYCYPMLLFKFHKIDIDRNRTLLGCR